MASDNKYFAAQEASKTADTLMEKTEFWYRNLDNTGYLYKLKTMWCAYQGTYYTGFSDSHGILFSGEEGEISNLAVNHLRNIANTIISMITSTRPSMQAKAVNTDYKSLVQTKLANGLLEYYMRDKRLEKYLHRAVEYAVVFGSGFIKMEWNATAGDVYDYNEELGIDIKEGDVEFMNLSPFDVVGDINREDDNHEWRVARYFKNKYDLIAKYPEHEKQILDLPTKNELTSFYIDSTTKDDTDLVAVYEFFHKRTDSMPDGRYMMYLSKDIILLDTPLPYREIPIYPLYFSQILGTSLGYSDLFDTLPLQDSINALYSSVLTNNTTFAIQNVLIPKGADIIPSQLAGELNILEYTPGMGDIKPLQLTSSPPETYNLISILERAMETISGVNAVSRGKPDPNLRSGNALALMQSMTLQYISKLQQSYVMVIEDIGTGLINLLKDFASVPRVASIVGKSNRSYMKEFTGSDLSAINRVIVDIGNPLSKTTAGRVEMADNLLQMGSITTPEQYFSVINTGQLDVMTEDIQSALFGIKGENERLVADEPVIAVFTDDHAMHIREHSSILSDPELRFDPALVARVQAHIQEHIDLLRNTSPELLQILGQQPLAPATPGGRPMPQDQQQMQGPPNQQMPDMLGGENIGGTQMEQMGATVNMPKPAQPPPVNGQVPPSTPQQLAMRNGQG